MITDKITFKALKNAPSPKEVDYWIDTATDPNGGTIKYNNGKEWAQLNSKGDDNTSTDEQVFDPHRKITAKYFIPEESVNTQIQLFYQYFLYYIEKLYINGEQIDIEETKQKGGFIFDKPGEYTVEILTLPDASFGPVFLSNNYLIEIDFSNYNFSHSISSSYFYYCENLKYANFNGAIFNSGSFYCMFQYCSNLKKVDFSESDLSKIDSLTNMFDNCGIEEFDFNKVFKNTNLPSRINCYYLFYKCSNLRTFSIRNVTTILDYMQSTFYQCSNLQTVQIINCVINGMNNTFDECSALKEVDFSNSKITGNIYRLFTGLNKCIFKFLNTQFNNPESFSHIIDQCQDCELNFDKSIWNNLSAYGMFSNTENPECEITFGNQLNNCICISNMFSNATIKKVKIEYVNFDNVPQTYQVFSDVTADNIIFLNSRNINMDSWFHESKIKNLSVDDCSILNLHSTFFGSDLSHINLLYNDLSRCIDMAGAFKNCENLTEVKMSGPIPADVNVTDMFSEVTTTGTFYYDGNYDYSKIIAVLPETWTAVDTSAQ